MAHGGRARGEMGGGGTREQCGSNSGEVAHGGRARGEMGGGGGAPESSVGATKDARGAPESSVGATKHALGPLKT